MLASFFVCGSLLLAQLRQDFLPFLFFFPGPELKGYNEATRVARVCLIISVPCEASEAAGSSSVAATNHSA